MSNNSKRLFAIMMAVALISNNVYLLPASAEEGNIDSQDTYEEAEEFEVYDEYLEEDFEEDVVYGEDEDSIFTESVNEDKENDLNELSFDEDDGFFDGDQMSDLDGIDLNELIPIIESEPITMINPEYDGVVDLTQDEDVQKLFEEGSENTAIDETEPILFEVYEPVGSFESGSEVIDQSVEEASDSEEDILIGFTSETLMADATTQPEYLSDYVAASKIVQQALTNRETEFTVYLDFEDYSQSAQIITDIIDMAYEHDGNPVHGDYLRWNWKGYSVSRARKLVNGHYLVNCTMNFTYYHSRAEEEQLTEDLDRLLDEMGLEEMSDDEIIRTIFDYICSNITYDHTSPDSNNTKYTAYGAFYDKTAVCQGYATLFYRLVLQSGIDSRVISGDGGGRHAWNIVEYNDSYYNIDATWDAITNYGEIYPYDYYMRCPDHFPRHFSDPEFLTAAFLEEYPMAEKCYHTHDFVISKETIHHEYVPPTCEETGSYEYWECEQCSRFFSDSYCLERAYGEQEIAPIGHSITFLRYVEPTCEEAGREPYWGCYRCQKGFTDSTGKTSLDRIPVIEAYGHDLLETPEVPATCISTGMTRGLSCKRCEKELEVPKEIPILNTHDCIHYEQVDAGYDSIGYKEYWECQTCSKLFSDQDSEYCIEEREVIPMLPVSSLKIGLKSAVALAYNKIQVSWVEPDDAQMKQYYVYRHAPGQKWTRIAVVSGKTFSYIDTAATNNVLEVGTQYTYTVRGVSLFDDENGSARITGYDANGVTAKMALGLPKLLSAAGKTYNTNVITWGKVAGAQGYGIWRKEANTGWKRIGTVNSATLSFTDKTPYTQVTYYYTVRAYTTTQNGTVWGPYDTKGISAIAKLNAPTLLSAKRLNGKNVIRWSAVAGANGYAVYRKVPGKSWVRVTNLFGNSVTTYTDTASSLYIYTVRAFRKNPDMKYVYSSYNTSGIKVS